MSDNNWWPEFRKYAQALDKLNHLPEVMTRNLHATTGLFALLKERQPETVVVAPGQIEGLCKVAEELLKEMEILRQRAQREQSRKFYTAFSQIVGEGLKEVRASTLMFPTTGPGTVPRQARPTESLRESSWANQLGTQLYDLKKKYIPIMMAQQEAKAEKGLKSTTADEADRLESFYETCEQWLRHLYALEYSKRILEENIEDTQTPVVKEPLPLQFRLERNKPSYTTRLIKASYQTPTSDDVTTLDIINGCNSIPTFDRDGKTLIDDKEVIRFVRLHSVKDDLLNFKNDPLSQIAVQMYEALVQVVSTIKPLSKETISLINRTPMQDMEYAFAGIIPDECRTVLRLKFNALLPGINEDHYRKSQNKGPTERSTRTIEAMEEFKRNFEKAKKAQLSSLKSNLAMSYWLRKMLTSVIRNNQTLKKKASEEKDPQAGDKTAAVDFDKWMLVGTSQTIGEEDIANFYINPDDIIGTQMSIQRVDRTDKWIAVRKSEKMHRIRKKDFFFVIQKFIDDDLNPAQKEYGFRTIDMKQQLLPEIHERLGDIHRIDLLRSGILGTIITNLEEFFEAKAFHKTMRRYFQKPDYDNIHYPTHEKLSQLAGGLAHSNTSILQMKYRRVLKVMGEIKEEIDRLSTDIQSVTGAAELKELTERRQKTQNLQRIIKKVQEILIFAKPTLKDVRVEPDEEYNVVT